MRLSTSEEQLMNYLWKLGKAFMKDLLQAYPDPKPAPTTVATLLKRMIDKKVVAYKTYGNSREYYPLINKSTYFGHQVKGMIKNFFDNSPSQFASFFTSETDLTDEELRDLKKLIDQQLKNKTS
ncbi:BlaI/MecI/CopY family transcriptional regulator [Echinicola vietnamensis]|uniref:Putative transcriptional regulator n=1 Tax=Echinicola vietnamensis (strain DSM 17526 / LMG 23754 / KMM 6221) TaxID=926556 RepID=L0FZ27_ECHVK|nr:BlaI/MecI/CopY family transcriptional regulator [Echinicola vietnamensis]AGA79174.1 putative transcriptional regulator [Echinicola vietnamensis DSM 17526]